MVWIYNRWLLELNRMKRSAWGLGYGRVSPLIFNCRSNYFFTFILSYLFIFTSGYLSLYFFGLLNNSIFLFKCYRLKRGLESMYTVIQINHKAVEARVNGTAGHQNAYKLNSNSQKALIINSKSLFTSTWTA